ncbi:MAG: M23 family metallopeptidase [Syntrophales bacterium]|nr:M23 family metallopeptidase [Syntrophales bacterium]
MTDQNSMQKLVFTIDEIALPEFKEWLFCPGMLFQAAGKWWGNKGLRDRRHEGLDLLLYKDGEERIRHIDKSFKIRVMSDGVVVGIIPDFLGKSIIVEHPSLIDNSYNILTIYGHTAPCDNIHVGLALQGGDIIASVAGPNRSSTAMKPHLHITVARTNMAICYERLNWEIIGTSEMLTLLDPLMFIGSPYRILGDDDPADR